jgi:hypothetical protein
MAKKSCKNKSLALDGFGKLIQAKLQNQQEPVQIATKQSDLFRIKKQTCISLNSYTASSFCGQSRRFNAGDAVENLKHNARIHHIYIYEKSNGCEALSSALNQHT